MIHEQRRTGRRQVSRRRRRVAVALVAAAGIVAGGALTAIADSSPAPAALLSDDFSSGAGTWSVSGGSWAVDAQGRMAQTSTAKKTAKAQAGSTRWTDYAMQARVGAVHVTADGGSAGIAVRSGRGSTFARLVLTTGGRAQVEIVRSGKASVVAATADPVSLDAWHTLRLEVRGTSLKGYVDGTLAVPTGGELTGLPAEGRVALQTTKATAAFDDVVVSALTDAGTTPPPATTTPPTTTPTPTTPTTPAPSTMPPASSTTPPSTSPGTPAPSATSVTPTPGPAASWNPPAGMADAVNKVWAHEESTYGDLYGFKNYAWDQIMAGHGNINYCVRWESTSTVTAAQRDAVQSHLQAMFQQWMTAMTEDGKGWNQWPYPKVNVKVVGWAVKDRSLLKWNDKSVDVYVGDLSGGAPQCAPACGRFFHQNNDYSGCPGGSDHHYDMSLWLTDGFNGGAGGDWGQRVIREDFMAGLDKDVDMYLVHEIGHSFGLDDFYDWWPPGIAHGSFVMDGESSMDHVTEFDKWMLRDFWRHLKNRYTT